MPDMRLSIRRGRAVEEGKLFPVLRLFNRFFKDVVFLPEVYDFFFARYEIERGVYFLIHFLSPYKK